MALTQPEAKCSPPTAPASGPTPRALFAATHALEKVESFERRRQQLPPKAGAPWTEDEERRLLASFDAGRGLVEIARAHERSQTGVRARLVKYGRLAA